MDVLKTIRGLVRPTTTWVATAAMIGMAICEQLGYGEVPKWFVVQVGLMWMYWYKTRDEEARNNSA